MGRDNHNAGIHFKKYSNRSKEVDLSYYDKNSEQGLANKRNEAIARLKELGTFEFTEPASFIEIAKGEFGYSELYHLYLYDKKYDEELRSVSSLKKLHSNSFTSDQGLRVRIHNTHRMVYITTELYEMKKHLFRKGMVFEIKPWYYIADNKLL